MADILKNLTKPKPSDTIYDEIIARVMERHAESKGFESQESELAATLQALHEMTGIPMHEIEAIATSVQSEHAGPPVSSTPTAPISPPVAQDADDLYFQSQIQKLERGKRGFVYQLIPYLSINAILVFLNIYSTSFPWALFPAAFWGIGLVSHFMGAVHWPRKALKDRQQRLKSQLHHILIENSSFYRTQNDTSYYNGLYRLTVSHSRPEVLEEYLANRDSSLSQNAIKAISTQVTALQEEAIDTQKSVLPNWQEEKWASKREGKMYHQKSKSRRF